MGKVAHCKGYGIGKSLLGLLMRQFKAERLPNLVAC